MAFHGSRDATDYGRRPVTYNTCNNGGFLGFLPLQAGGDFRKTGCNPVWDGESHAFRQLFGSLGAFTEWPEWDGQRTFVLRDCIRCLSRPSTKPIGMGTMTSAMTDTGEDQSRALASTRIR